MAMITATKEFTFDMAHMLGGHSAACRNLHGHTYKLQVTAVRRKTTSPPKNSDLPGMPMPQLAERGSSAGMVCDFQELKRIVKEEIIDKFDHATVIYSQSLDPFEAHLCNLLGEYGKKRVCVNYRPTAENMAKEWLEKLDYHIRAVDRNLSILSIKLWETPTSYAEASKTMEEVIEEWRQGE